jgi:integrase
MKKRKEHRVPLCDRAVAIFKAMPAGSEYLFPGTRAGRPLSKDAMSELLKAMGLSAEDVTTHGFRSTLEDWIAETTDYPEEVRKLALAHAVSDKTEAAYRRGDLLAKRHRLMADWERFCSDGS